MDENILNICSIQPELHVGDINKNLAEIHGLMYQALGLYETDLIVLPENFIMWGPKRGKTKNPQTILDFLAERAKEFNVFIIGGSFHHLDKNEGKYYNTCYIFNPGGEIICEYSKRKLFGKELEHGISPGKESAIFNIGQWKIGILICADLWFPELTREIMDEAHILAVPAQSVVRNKKYQTYGRNLWHALALTRAQENSMITIVADHPVLPRKPYCAGAYSVCDPSLSSITNDLNRILLKDINGEPGFIHQQLDYHRLMEFRRHRTQRGLLPTNTF